MGKDNGGSGEETSQIFSFARNSTPLSIKWGSGEKGSFFSTIIFANRRRLVASQTKNLCELYNLTKKNAYA